MKICEGYTGAIIQGVGIGIMLCLSLCEMFVVTNGVIAFEYQGY